KRLDSHQFQMVFFKLDFMIPSTYNNDAKPTALWPKGGTAVLKYLPKRAIIFIDGSNWYHKLRSLLQINNESTSEVKKPPVDFDLRLFAINLVMPDELNEIRYYIGKVRRLKNNQKSEVMYANQQRLIGFLQQQNISIGFGNLINYPDGSFHEKGVDILLAVEM